jgi:UDP-N-acetylmuramate dehydrogenase
MLLEENKALAPYTTLGIGGPARWYAEATTEEDVAEAVAWARERGVELFVLGGGSNLLVADAGFDGLVLRIGLRGNQRREGAAGCVLYQLGAGEDWDRFVERTTQDDCAGLECLAGIPGTVGGTPVQNVGAYGQEVASCIERVRAFDLRTPAFVEFAAEDCGFAYRRSRFNTTDRGRYAVTQVDFRLVSGGAPSLRYAELQRAFPEGSTPNLVQVASAVRRIRRSKGMLLVEGDPDCRSAGSFFKNPVVTRERFEQVAAGSTETPPCFPAAPGPEYGGVVKLSAAWLIEQAGFAKGYKKGDAGISSRHTLALVNRGGATAAEILSLASEIADTVDARFGIRLEREPELLGFKKIHLGDLQPLNDSSVLGGRGDI